MDIGPEEHERRSRREFLCGAGGLVGAAAIAGGAFAAARLGRASAAARAPLAALPAAPARSFRSRPDLHPAALSIAGSGGVGDGYLFLGPGALGRVQAGPLIADGDGEPVWFKPLSGAWLANFRSWSYRGDPVLAWWQGVVVMPLGYGRGEGLILDRSYRDLIRIRPAGGRIMDMHELRLTPQGTALFTCYPRVTTTDLSAIGGPRDGQVLESIFQEVDLRTGRLLLEWRSLDHIGVTESYRPLADPYDYLHLNSIDVAPDGNLLVSGRHTFTIYKLDRRTGEVIWRLGGKNSEFDLDSDGWFSWQHDAEMPSPGILTLFDNGYDGHTQSESQSRALILSLDEARRSARPAQALYHPSPLLASSMGSVQILPDRHVLVGWGSEPYLDEFAPDGTILADVRLASGQQCYRSFRLPWTGHPHRAPALRAAPDRAGGRSTLYASWNGSTELDSWGVLAGPHPSGLRAIGKISRRGFETAISLNGDSGYVAVTALDPGGRVLGASPTIRL